MFRPVFILSLILTIVTTACERVRLLPDGEEAQTGEVQDIQPTLAVLEERKPYRLQEGSPTWLPNFLHPEAGCDWLGVAGQVFDTEGNPVTALVVEVGGTLRGLQVQSFSLTGIAPGYGPSGYEVQLEDQAVDSNASLWIQLKDLSGKELSSQIPFDTSDDCNQNLVLVNFVESNIEIEVIEYFFPVFYNNVSGSERKSPENGESGDRSTYETYFPLLFHSFFSELIETPSP